jgi:hypothetical protein
VLTKALTPMLHVVVATTLLAACDDGDLRGRTVPSPDGRTYFVVDDGNGDWCAARLLVDGAPWPHKLHARGAIQPGSHRVACADTTNGFSFDIQEGTTYHFDYWGP